MNRMATGTLIIGGLMLFGVGVLQLLETGRYRSDDKLQIVWPASDLGEVDVGQHELVIDGCNPADQPRTIRGLLQGCRRNVCFGPKHGVPVTVPPGGSARIVAEISVTGSGPFELPLVLYREDGGIHPVEHIVRGIGDRSQP